MKDKIWSAEYKGHIIRAINKFSFFPPKTSELLEVDGVLIREIKGSLFRMNSIIFAKNQFAGEEQEIEVRIAQKSGGAGTGCQIFIDGTQIGGDKTIQYPDPEKAEKQVERGYFRYFITSGLLSFGVPFAVIMAIFNMADPILTMAWKFVFHAFFFGLAMSYFSWRGIKSGILSRENSRK